MRIRASQLWQQPSLYADDLATAGQGTKGAGVRRHGRRPPVATDRTTRERAVACAYRLTLERNLDHQDVLDGRIRHIAVAAAERASGVLAVITHLNAPVLVRGPMTPLRPPPLPPLQNDVVTHFGQHVAIVVAEAREQAQAEPR